MKIKEIPDLYQNWEISSNFCSLLQKHKLCFCLRGRSQTTFTRFGFFWPPTPLRLHFLWYKSLQKVDFFDHLPPSSCKHSLWTAPYMKSYDNGNQNLYFYTNQTLRKLKSRPFVFSGFTAQHNRLWNGCFFPSLSLSTNHNTAWQSTLPSCAVIGCNTIHQNYRDNQMVWL